MRRIADAFVQAFKGMFRNGLITFICLFVLTSCLVFVGCFSMVSRNINYNLEMITGLNEIDVFLDPDLSDEEALAVQQKINGLDNVERTELTTKSQGLAEVKGDYAGWEDVLDNLSNEENPLPHRVRVFYIDNAKVANLDYELKNMQADGVISVNSRFDIAASVESLQNVISTVFICFTVLCVVICTFVVLNTIKMSVYLRREEITIMRYIGASRAYIAAPFVLEGIFIGAIGATVAFFIEKLIYSVLMDFVAGKMGFVTLYSFGALTPELLALFFGISMFTGIVGSIFSLGKYVEA